MEDVDWDKGLPSDVLALVARAGGIKEMEQMRGVSHQWQEGFELGVTGITLTLRDPLLPWDMARRFPAVASLDLGNSAVDEAWLQSLQTLAKLKSLVLGVTEDSTWGSSRKTLASRLTDFGLHCLWGLPLTLLDLEMCKHITDRGLEALYGMPLTSLNLGHCYDITTEGICRLVPGMPLKRLVLDKSGALSSVVGSDCLQRLSLTSLSLKGRMGLESEARCEEMSLGLGVLRGMPLTDLTLSQNEWLTNAGLDQLRGLPLTSLDLTDSAMLTWEEARDLSDGLFALRAMPLVRLRVGEYFWMGDAGLEKLRDLNLTSLDLHLCGDLSGEGLSNLKNLPLTELNLGSASIDNQGLRWLRGLPLTVLDLCSCKHISDAGLEYLKDLPLSHLNLVGTSVGDDGLGWLRGMPLTILELYTCACIAGISDAGLENLRNLPLTHLCLSQCGQISSLGLGVLKNAPISRLELSDGNITDDGIEDLCGMPLTNLHLVRCKKLSNESLMKLKCLPLTALNLAGCKWVSDWGLEQLKGMPIKEFILSGCELVSDASLPHLLGMPLNQNQCKQLFKVECRVQSSSW